jgi:alpha-ketoglutarate-dependent taurine dioxygenase
MKRSLNANIKVAKKSHDELEALFKEQTVQLIHAQAALEAREQYCRGIERRFGEVSRSS